MKAASLFSGVGGFDLGLERAGMEIVFQCENNKDCQKILDLHWPNTPGHYDIESLCGDALPELDLMVGGFPCQDLSVAGARAGLAGVRSGLFFEFARLAEEVHPQFLLIENVPGLLSSHKGQDMGTVVGTLADLGYGWAYRVLDAQFFGVAQRRRRVFIVGCFGDTRGAAEVLFESAGSSGDPPTRRESGEVPAALTANGVGTCGADDNQGQAGHLIPTTFDWQLGSSGDSSFRGESRAWIDDKPDGPVRSLVANRTMAVGFHVTQDPISETEFTPVMSAGNRQGCSTLGVVAPIALRGRTEGQEWEVGAGGKSGDGSSSHNWALIDMAVRRLTPVECERLQGFPDNYTSTLPDSARYRVLGNAVAVPVVEWIGRRMLSVFNSRYEGAHRA